MTTVRTPICPVFSGARVDGKLRWAVLVSLLAVATATAEEQSVHWRHAGAMPPGAIGSQRLVGVGSLSFFVQPVEVMAPSGARIAFAEGDAFGPAEPAPRLAGMQIARVYRMRVTDLRGQPGIEVFPTIEVIDRLYAPPQEALRFPIPVELTAEELRLAAEGAFVTRVIFVENPDAATPITQKDEEQSWFEARPGEDPLAVADRLGRPVAILRIGGRLPDRGIEGDAKFFFGSPRVMLFNRAAENSR